VSSTDSNAKSKPRSVLCRGVRGATTTDANTHDAILEATRELLSTIIRLNDMHAEDVASVFFTTSSDLNAEYPALAARQLGWTETALMCAHEMDVPHGVKLCIRVLIHWNTDRFMSEIQHVYLRGATILRPDRSLDHLRSSQEIQSQQ